jgi:5-formyltetrahydrofolate cyclo-ligase
MQPAWLKVYKQLFRARMRRMLASISAAQKTARSRRVITRLRRSAVYQKAKSVFIYVSTPQEVNTRPVIRDLLKRRKRVWVPRIDRKSKRIRVIQIQNLKKDLKRGSFGLLEPRRLNRELRDLGRIDVAIIPGLAFDQQGQRLGRGGGYFDRFLKQIPKAYKIGIAFKEQRLREVPSGAHDIRVNKVFTD